MKFKDFAKKLITENPVLVMALGLCPTIAMSGALQNAFYLGLATLLVVVLSSTVISLTRKLIPESVRLPSYILIIATLTTITQMLMARYLPGIYEQIGLFISLIIVNCIVLGRAESYASKNTVGYSALDALFIGLGFLVSICILGTFREIIGANSLTIFGWENLIKGYTPIKLIVEPAGGFIMLGLLMALFNFVIDLVKNQSKKSKSKHEPVLEDQVYKAEEKPAQKIETAKTGKQPVKKETKTGKKAVATKNTTSGKQPVKTTAKKLTENKSVKAEKQPAKTLVKKNRGAK